MTESVQEKFVCKSMSTLQHNMGVAFNNPEYSDTTFIIQGNKFYAWSGLLSIASPTLGSLVSEHFAICDDREITLYKIKYDESFTTILKHIYGLDIEFTKIDSYVICEVLALSETYKLTNFIKDLKDYLSKMNCFSLDSTVILLNTASKYDIQNLYKQLTVFAYQNADQLVKHESFHNLEYNVLLELIKSDWFCCEEIDILKGILTWHSDMVAERKKIENRLKETNVDKDAIDNPDLDSDTSDLTTNNSDKLELPISENSDKLMESVNSFSENILKSLLGQIRISQISMLALLKEMKENQEPFKNYNHFLMDVNHFSQICKPRQEYKLLSNVQQKDQNSDSVTGAIPSRVVQVMNDITKTFEITGRGQNTITLESNSKCIQDLTWNIALKAIFNLPTKETLYTYMSLTCCSNYEKTLTCNVDCQLKWISTTQLYDSLILPYKSLDFKCEKGKLVTLEIGRWLMNNCKPSDWRDAFFANNTRTFQLHFKSIRITKEM
ncbi:hypothetical protein WDU94_000270 [Cyamophila willieti]